MAHLALDWTSHPPLDFTGGAGAGGEFGRAPRGALAPGGRGRCAAGGGGGPGGGPPVGPPPLARFAPAAPQPPPAPLAILHPAAAKPPLTTVEDRASRLQAAGATHVATLRVDAGLLALTPEAFFEDVIVGLFRARAVVEGYNFRFGRGRAGDTA